MSIDSIGNFLTVMRNGIMVSKRQVSVPFSKLRFNMARVLLNEGFVKGIKKVETDKGPAPC